MCKKPSHYFYWSVGFFFCAQQCLYSPPADAQNVMVSESAEQQPGPSTALDTMLARYPAGSIHTAEEASRAGEDVHKMHALIDTQFVDERNVCLQKFFATSCLEKAKERHRVAMAKVRSIEIEVNQFKRRSNVIAREKALASKNDKEATELANHREENQSENARDALDPSRPLSVQSAEKSHNSANARLEKHQNEVKTRQLEEAENEKQRASHIAAYEKKRQKAEARQREIAEKKLQKARAQNAKDTSEAK